MIEASTSFLDAPWFENLMIAYLCVMSFVAAIAAIARGRSLLGWAIPIIVFPPLLIVLLKLPTTKRAEQVQCGDCELWNPLRRKTCARCGHSLEDGSSMIG